MDHAQLTRLGTHFRHRHERNRLNRERAETHAARWSIAVTMLTVLVIVSVFAVA